MCFFMWEAIRYHADVSETLTTATLLREQVAKTDLEIVLAEKGVLPAVFNETYERQTRIRVRLLSYAHLVELSAVYDLIFAVIRIALGHVRLFDHAERSVRPVPIGFEEDQGRMAVRKKVKKIIEITKETQFDTIGVLLDFIYDSRLRNAVAHAKYSLREDMVRLTEPGVDLPVDRAMEMSDALLALFRGFLNGIYMERERFFDGPPVREGDFTLFPERNDAGYQIRIEG